MSSREKLETCADCDVAAGARHQRGCELERCPFCFGPLAS